MTALLLLTGGFVGIFGFGEFTHRLFRFPSETTRKLVHILAGLLAFTLPWYLVLQEALILGVVFAVLLVISQKFNILSSIHAVERSTVGGVAFPLGLLLAAILFFHDSPQAFQFGVLILALADSAAFFIGNKLGRHKIAVMDGKKTYEGSIAFFLVTLAIGLAFALLSQPLTGLVVLQIMGLAAALTVVESLAVRGLDNFVLPALAGIFALWLGLL